jgi:hypothetical protein
VTEVEPVISPITSSPKGVFCGVDLGEIQLVLKLPMSISFASNIRQISAVITSYLNWIWRVGFQSRCFDDRL